MKLSFAKNLLDFYYLNVLSSRFTTPVYVRLSSYSCIDLGSRKPISSPFDLSRSNFFSLLNKCLTVELINFYERLAADPKLDNISFEVVLFGLVGIGSISI